MAMSFKDILAQQKQAQQKPVQDAKPSEQVAPGASKSISLFAKPKAEPNLQQGARPEAKPLGAFGKLIGAPKPQTIATPEIKLYDSATAKPAPTPEEKPKISLGFSKAAAKPKTPETGDPMRFAKAAENAIAKGEVPREEKSFSVSDLATVRMEEVESAKDFQFPDQPGEFSEQDVIEFRRTLAFLKDNLEHKEAVAESVKVIVAQLRAHPTMREILLPEDFGAMVEGVRRSYGHLAAKASEKKSKKAASNQEADEFTRLLLGAMKT
jgi:hypothetical protein